MKLRIVCVTLLISAMVVLLFGCSLIIDDALGHGQGQSSESVGHMGEQVETSYTPSLYYSSENYSAFSHGRYLTHDDVIDEIDVDDSASQDNNKDGEPIVPNEHMAENDDMEVHAGVEQVEQIPLKQVALTFDDGPDETITPIILEHLDRYNAKATFFMLGYRVEAHPEIVKQVHEAGHEIGNHSWNHPQLTILKPASILEQIDKTDEAIEAITGFAPILVRPPYGDVNQKVIDTVPGILINWSIDTADWRDRDADMIMQQVEDKIDEGSIILMHDTYATTAEAVELILAKYTEEGYEFVTVSELLDFEVNEPVSGKVYTRQ